MSLKAQDVYGILNSKIEEGSGDPGTSDYNGLTNKPKINGVELSGEKSLEDLGIQPAGDYLTEETDPTVPSWAKQATKPSYTAEEVGALPNTTVIPEIDNTLSVSGDAADSKVVGDKFTEVDKNVESIEENISDIKDDLVNTSDAIYGETSGSSILITDSGEKDFNGLSIFGKSTQDGTPSPENPVPIVSAGDEGEINVEVLGGNLADISQVVNIVGSSYVQISDTGFSFTYSEKESDTRLNRIPCKLKAGKQYICTAELSSNYIQIYLPEIEQYLRFGQKFTPNEDVNYIGVFVNFGDPYDTYTVEHFMVNVWDTALSWEPYKTPQTLTLSTPGGLPGIPVASGGNYTDADGQQWVCDEIDLARGKYVQRVAKRIVESSDIYNIENEKQNTNLFGIGSIPPATNKSTIGGNYLYCNILDSVPDELDVYEYDSPGIGYTSGSNFIRLNMSNTGAGESVETFKNYLDTMQESGNPVYILYIIATPIETDLTAEEIAAYQSIHTYKPTTTITNDANTYMEVSYVKDIEQVINNTVNETVESAIDNYDTEIKSFVDTNYVKKTDLDTEQEKLEKYIESYYALRRNGKVYQTKLWKFVTNPTSEGEKLLSNTGLVFSPSTDTTEGQDDYLNGHHPMFEWVNVNYVRDNDGTARPTAIEGMDNYATSGSVDVGVMQMSFYWKWDTSNAEYDLITVSDSTHPELGLEPWPECVKEDGTVLPWCIGSKYISGIASDGLLRSQPGLKPERKQSHNNMITNYQLKGIGYWGAGAVRNLFQIVFNAIKGATKNSQTLYQGVTSWSYQYEASVQRTENLTYFPVTNEQATNLVVGNYVSVGYGYNNNGTISIDRGNDNLHMYADDVKILSIETLDENNKAVYLDIDTGFNTTPVTLTEELTAPIVMSTMHSWSGMTDSVLGKHDGSPISNTNSKMPYRVQGREYAVGGYIIASDTVMDLQGDFTKNVYVAEKGTARSSSDSTIRSTYKMVGTIPATAAGNNADWWIGDIAVDMDTGVWYPSVEGSSSSQGMADRCYAGGSTATSGTRGYLQGGYLGLGLFAGSAYLSCWVGLSWTNWLCLGCD